LDPSSLQRCDPHIHLVCYSVFKVPCRFRRLNYNSTKKRGCQPPFFIFCFRVKCKSNFPFSGDKWNLLFHKDFINQTLSVIIILCAHGGKDVHMKCKQLSLEDRKTIQSGIENRQSKTTIVRQLGKHPSTIAKEIRRHRIFKPRNRFNSPVICTQFKHCKKTRSCCMTSCPNYREQTCLERDRSIGACNHCPHINRCRLDHYFYNADSAHKDYLFLLSDSRQGKTITTSSEPFYPTEESSHPLPKRISICSSVTSMPYPEKSWLGKLPMKSFGSFMAQRFSQNWEFNPFHRMP